MLDKHLAEAAVDCGEESDDEEVAKPVLPSLSSTFIRQRAAAERTMRLLLLGDCNPSAAVRVILDCLAEYGGEPIASYSEGGEASSQLRDKDDAADSDDEHQEGVTDSSKRMAPVTPADLVAISRASRQSGKRGPSRRLCERLTANLLPRWMADMRGEGGARSGDRGSRWIAALITIAKRVLASPDDPAAVGVLAKLAGRGLLSGKNEAAAIAHEAKAAMKGQVREH